MVLLVGCAPHSPDVATPKAPVKQTAETTVDVRQAPDFSVTSVSGKEISLAKSKKEGKPTVVYFMASWCPKCAKNWQGINEAYPAYKDKVNFVAISIDPTDDVDTIRTLAEEKGFVFEAAPGNPDVAKAFGVTEQTTKFAIDADGNIVNTHKGVLSPEEWDDFIASVA